MKYTPAKQQAMAALKFDEALHRYTYQGMVIPNVSSIIEPLEPFGNLPPDVRKAALQRGTLVHRLTELYDQRVDGIEPNDWWDIEKAGLDGYLIAWESFKQHSSLEIIESEQRVFHTKYRYAGTFDRVVRIGSDIGILDIKTGALVEAYKLQTAAYLMALDEFGQMYPMPTKRWVVSLQPDGRYRFEEHTDPADFEVFIAALTIAQWQMRSKKK